MWHGGFAADMDKPDNPLAGVQSFFAGLTGDDDKKDDEPKEDEPAPDEPPAEEKSD